VTVTGEDCFLYALRLLVRICPNVSVCIPAGNGNLLRMAEDVTNQTSFGNTVSFVSEDIDYKQYDAILSVGTKAHPELPWTVINSDNWVVRVSSGQEDIASARGCRNPVGSLAAASLGVGEVFKRLVMFRPECGKYLDGLSYSLHSYEADPTDTGPALPTSIDPDLLLVGGGAIGNGIAALLERLPLKGTVTIVDYQAYGEENLGTCLLIGPRDIGRKKADVLADLLASAGVRVRPKAETFDKYAESLKGGSYPSVVLNGLDSVDVRREVQRALWPDIIIDGAIGDFMCQVSRHAWDDLDTACLRCLFGDAVNLSAEGIQQLATGLPVERLRDPDSLLSDEDIQAAPTEKREFLSTQRGKPICSVVPAAILKFISK
jgi:hypothetical protein